MQQATITAEKEWTVCQQGSEPILQFPLMVKQPRNILHCTTCLAISISQVPNLLSLSKSTSRRAVESTLKKGLTARCHPDPLPTHPTAKRLLAESCLSSYSRLATTNITLNRRYLSRTSLTHPHRMELKVAQ